MKSLAKFESNLGAHNNGDRASSDSVSAPTRLASGCLVDRVTPNNLEADVDGDRASLGCVAASTRSMAVPGAVKGTPTPEAFTIDRQREGLGRAGSAVGTNALGLYRSQERIPSVGSETDLKPKKAAINGNYFRLADIARALNLDKRVVMRMAERESWPMHQCGNRFEYCPPQRVADLIVARPSMPSEEPNHHGVKFTDLAHESSQRDVVLLREQSVVLLHQNLGMGKEVALRAVVNFMRTEHPLFRCSVNSLRIWDDKYQLLGIDGLVEQKKGRVGRKPFAADLTPEIILRGRAMAVETGIKGETNAARAYRELTSDPTLPQYAKQHLHGNHASKSYVPPSIRKALRVPQYTVDLIQVGPHEAKLNGPYTECDYGKVPAGRAFTCDDMTANVYVWCEWPCEQGFILIRPQILAALDVGSGAWLTIRAIMRSRGQYNRDDAWGLIGDVFDEYGLYEIAVLEGGIWQSNAFIGERTSIDDNTRFGGLKSLGVKMYHARTPRAKLIENAFHRLQAAADRVPGYCGRNEREDCPEEVKKHKYEVEHGQAHPSKYFLHITQYSEHLQKIMQSLNNESQDGKILRGLSPAEKWKQDDPTFRKVPASAQWMYRSTFNIKPVTRNGITVSIGSGKYKLSYTYNSLELEAYRGHRVCIFWNDYNTETSAIIYTMRDGKPHEFICAAPLLPGLDRFDATTEEQAAEERRKAMVHHLAVSQTKSLAPYLQRKQKLIPTGPVQNDIAAKIAAARKAAEQKREIETAAKRATAKLPDVDLQELSTTAETPIQNQGMVDIDILKELR